MPRSLSRQLVSALSGLALCLGLAACQVASAPAPSDPPPTLPYYADASFTPHWFEAPSAVPNTFHAIADFALTNQQGKAVTHEDIEGTLTIANFFFTSCPGICPMTMSNMARLQDTFAEDATVMLLSHSVTPEKDSVAALSDFAERTHALASKWNLVTGDREQMYALGKSSYFADEDLGEATDDAAFTHTESFFLIDSNRRIRGVYNGMNTAAVDQLIEDVRTLQASS